MNKHIFQILGRLNRFYLLKLFIPLISIVGVIIITILLLASSFILLLNLRHRDVTKSLFDNLKSSSNHASESIKQKENKIRLKRRKSSIKRGKIERKTKKSRQNNNVIKDVSDFPEISQSDDIPIYGHNEQEDKRQNTTNQRQKRVLDNEQFQQSLPSTKNQSINNNQLSTTAENNHQQSQAEGSISEAGEEANIEYTVPPLSLLKQPTKQKLLQKLKSNVKVRF